MRLEQKIGGQEREGKKDRITDQTVGRVEAGLRREMKEEELIRSDEAVRSNRARIRAQQEAAEKRRKHEEDIFRQKKRKVELGFVVN